MINRELLNPESIVVVGGSNDTTKPGGKILKNIIDGNYGGRLWVVNRNETEVQGIKCFASPGDLPEVELAIIAIAARFVFDVVKILTEKKKTRAFIVLTAGFSEESEEGRMMEEKIAGQVNAYNGALIGPNCIGVLTPAYSGVFTLPIPKLQHDGCDFISGSGATACFIMEAGIPRGLTFANVFSVGNSAQMGVEEILRFMDESYESGKSSNVKLLYIENLKKPEMLLKHASSLVRKGCYIAAIKAGVSEAGSRAASSHTGALASPDTAVDALFKKAGIVRCHSKEELISVASVFRHPPLKGKNIAVITHAGGPAVKLTDALSEGGLSVPPITGPKAEELKQRLFPGSSVSNPIDFLATGTAGQLGFIIDFVEEKLDQMDAMVVIFGTPGLFPVNDVYDLLDRKMSACSKPIYPVLPSTLTAHAEVEEFLARGRINFPDEVALAEALARVYYKTSPKEPAKPGFQINTANIRKVVDNRSEGYLSPGDVQTLLDAVGIPRVPEKIVHNREEALDAAAEVGFPVVMKAVGPIHKSDTGGVILNISEIHKVGDYFNLLMTIENTSAVLVQSMKKGLEVFAGVKYESGYGHLIMCGLGGIFIEILKDVNCALLPIDQEDALDLIRKLKSYKILEGIRGTEGINLSLFAEILTRVSALTQAAPEISEMDLNPLMASGKDIFAVDVRICLRK
ncbi:MAG: acetate--CoA ligase family protein [Bacteroidales bacterium]|nr:acetate--CoA ligase family protein [Bacteroidales bacterium]